MNEIWKPIAGYEGKYMISNLGRVKSLSNNKNKKEKILKPGKNGHGYLFVTLCLNGKRKHFKIYRLVAKAFIPNPNKLPQVNHKDENKENNCVTNLEWCNNRYNVRYTQAKKVACYKEGKLIKIYYAIKDVDNDGFHCENVSSCCRGNLKSSGGYQWKYVD